MLVVGRSNIQTKLYGAPKIPSWDNGVLYNLSPRKAANVNIDPFSKAYMEALHKDARKKPNISADPVGLLQIGDFHFFNGKLWRAEQAYKAAARVSADKTQSYAKLIQVLQAQHKPEKVVRYYDMLAGISVDQLPFVTEKIAYCLNNIEALGQDFVEDLVESAFSSYPENEDVANLKGIYYLITGDIQKAKKEFGRLIYLNPLNVHGNNNLGVVYGELGDATKAIQYYSAAISADASYITGYENIAAVYSSDEKFDKALKILDKAKTAGLPLSEKWDHHYGFFLLQTNKLTQAIEWYRDKLKQEPNNQLLYNNLGKSYELSGQMRQALDCYEKATNIVRNGGGIQDDRKWLAFHNLMAIYDRIGNDNALLDTVSYVLAHNPNDSKAKYFKALVNIRTDDYDGARKLLEEVTAAEPNSPEALFNLAFIYETVDKRYDDGLELLYKTVELVDGKNNLMIQNNIAYALLKKGDTQKAEKILNDNKNLKEYHPFLATYGLFYFKKDQPKKADEYYKLAVVGLRGKERDIAKQVWHTEKAEYLLKNKEYIKALKEINVAVGTLKQGYSYDDSLDLKEQIIKKIEKQLIK